MSHLLVLLLGWYMVVDASDGDLNSYAAFQSPAMMQSGAECVLEFHYHMYGKGKTNEPEIECTIV